MDRLRKLSIVVFFTFLCGSLFGQTHISVPLDSQVYYILAQAQIRGLCAPLSGVKPYSRAVVISAIKEILDSDSGKLRPAEQAILERYMEKFDKPKTGIDWKRGGYFKEAAIGKSDFPITANVQMTADIEGSGGYYQSDELFFGTEIWLGFFVNGDIGGNVSYEIGAEGGLMKVPHRFLGKYNTYYEDFTDNGEFQNRNIDVYSEPLTHFPYTYKKRWDGSVFFIQDLYSFTTWPESLAGAYSLQPELTLSYLDSRVIARFSRIPHEWGSVSHGSSLHLNQAARPFGAIEAEFRPFSWFGIASMTGAMEYYQTESIKGSAMNFQNLYSITMFQFKYKNYIFVDLGEIVVWPKRFEIGYMLPIISTIFYQNNVGDFDNIAAMFNLKMQYPGIGNIWASIFWDEAFWVRNFSEVDGTMLALQTGMEAPLPFLSFSSLKISYTKVNPYCYTHNRNYNPWYGDLTMETSYTNNGVGLGYYLPPNSDEILARFQTMPVKSLTLSLQYQLIRHGADFGPNAVDGSNLLSELDPSGRHGDNLVSKRYFLRDGAYQWSHIIKVGTEWNLPKVPIVLCGEAGMNYSYFTNIEEKANVTGEPHPYARVNTADYPESTGFIVKIGLKIFPR
jgi:hypothetical protein